MQINNIFSKKILKSIKHSLSLFVQVKIQMIFYYNLFNSNNKLLILKIYMNFVQLLFMKLNTVLAKPTCLFYLNLNYSQTFFSFSINEEIRANS